MTNCPDKIFYSMRLMTVSHMIQELQPRHNSDQHTHTHKVKLYDPSLFFNGWGMKMAFHYENTPMQICRKFRLQKLKIFHISAQT